MAAITAALLGLSAAETLLKSRSERSAANIAQQQGNAQGSLFDLNATSADAQAKDAIARGDQNASGVARESRALSGEQRAGFAAEGIDLSTGSAAGVVANDRALSVLDETTIRNNAAREAFGFSTEATGYRMQGQWARTAGTNQAKALRTQSFSTLLSGAGGLAQIYSTAPKGVSSTGSTSP